MILLVNPPAPTVPRDTYDVPLGLAYIAATLARAGFPVQILDCGRMSIDTAKNLLAERIHERGIEVLGISSVSATYETAREILAYAKELDGSILSLHGGVHVTLAIRQVLSDPLNDADVLVLGEGEQTMLDIAIRYFGKKALHGTLGTAIKTRDGYALQAHRPFIEDLDSLPIPRRDLFSTDEIPVMRVLTSRGCPFDCSFCASTSLWDRYIRFHSPERVAREILDMSEQLGCRSVLIVDDTFTVNQSRAAAILERLPRNNIEYSCLTRVDCLSDTLMDIMKEANIKSISIGCESGDQDVLTAVRKGTTIAQIRSAIRGARKRRIRTRTSWIWGLPYDSVESLNKTVRLILQEQPDEVVIYRFVPYPGTEIFRAHPELGNLSPSRFHSGSAQFLIPIPSLSIEEMEVSFRRALETLYTNGYSDPGEAGPGARTATSAFTRFTSFWPGKEQSSVSQATKQ